MLILLKGGRIVDPVNERDEIGDLWIENGRIVAAPQGRQPDEVHDVSGKIVMAGAIDIHSHIAGGNVNTARLLLPEMHQSHLPIPPALPLSTAKWSTFETGCIYAAMGFTTVIEPADRAASSAAGASRAFRYSDHRQRCADGPRQRRFPACRCCATAKDRRRSPITSPRPWRRANGLGVKCINAGGATAFKYNARTFGLDDVVPFYGRHLAPDRRGLAAGGEDLKIPHPLHLHCQQSRRSRQCRDGARDDRGGARPASASRPSAVLCLWQRGRSRLFVRRRRTRRGRQRRAECHRRCRPGHVPANGHRSQSDVLRQFNGVRTGEPEEIRDPSTATRNGGGIVPYLYRENDFVNAIQWACGLELFMLIDDPWRVFFTTDHPNGAPFTTYPEVFALIMSRDARAEAIARLPQEAVAMTTLPSIDARI